MGSRFGLRIGIEIHAQLLAGKLFTHPGHAVYLDSFANRRESDRISVFDIGLPGALPVFNGAVKHSAIQACLLLNCRVSPSIKFVRKHYSYKDLPHGYQITQSTDGALGTDGVVHVDGHCIGIQRVGLEMDSAKTISGQIVDYSRAGIALVEIVCHPTITDTDMAVKYCKTIRDLLSYQGICNGDLETGAFRCDVNVSVDQYSGGTLARHAKCEIKNLNSFKSVSDAIKYEYARQVGLIEKNEPIQSWTMAFDPENRVTIPTRSKTRYNFIDESNVPAINVTEDDILLARSTLQPTREQISFQLAHLGLNEKTFEKLFSHKGAPQLLLSLLKAFNISVDDSSRSKASNDLETAHKIANWITNILFRLLQSFCIEISALPVESIAKTVGFVLDGQLPLRFSKNLLERYILLECKPSIESLAKEMGLLKSAASEREMELEITHMAASELEHCKANGQPPSCDRIIGKIIAQSGTRFDPKMVSVVVKKSIAQ